MAISSKPLSKQDYLKRIVEISEILKSTFKISDKTKKELLAKQQRYVDIINKPR